MIQHQSDKQQKKITTMTNGTNKGIITLLLLTYLFIYILTYSLAYLLTYLLTCLFTYLLTYLLAYLLAYLLTYLLTHLSTFLLTYLLTFLHNYLLAYLLVYLLTYLLIYLLTSYLLAYLLTYLLTPWSRVLLEKLTGSQPVKKFPAFCGTRKFIIAFIIARHLSLSTFWQTFTYHRLLVRLNWVRKGNFFLSRKVNMCVLWICVLSYIARL